jgi:hypothetical protein
VHGFTLTAELLYQLAGSTGLIEVEEYQWEIISGGDNWFLTFVNAPDVLRKTAQLVTDVSNDDTISVRGRKASGEWSVWAYCQIDRYAKAPCPITGAPPYLLTGDTSQFGLNATVSSALQGYTYEWEIPDEWEASFPGGITNIVIITPDGAHGGTVTLRAVAFGVSSAPCSVTIPLESPTNTTQAPPTAKAPAWTLFPNPVSDVLTVDYPAAQPSHSYTLLLTDITGREFTRTVWMPLQKEISLPTLPAGMYLASLFEEDVLIGTQKLVKQ